jgi:hypothetical protein
VVVTVDVRVNVVMSERVVLWYCNRTGGHGRYADAGRCAVRMIIVMVVIMVTDGVKIVEYTDSRMQ